jgi:uncharacterized protein (DUF885 family)
MPTNSLPEKVIKQSREKFNQMKEKMLEPIKQVQQSRKKDLRNLITEIEKKQSTLQEKRASLVKLCRE